MIIRCISIHQSKDYQYYWNLLAKNGQVLATSEDYKTLRGCYKTAYKIAKDIGTYINFARSVANKAQAIKIALKLGRV